MGKKTDFSTTKSHHIIGLWVKVSLIYCRSYCRSRINQGIFQETNLKGAARLQDSSAAELRLALFWNVMQLRHVGRPTLGGNRPRNPGAIMQTFKGDKPSGETVAEKSGESIPFLKSVARCDRRQQNPYRTQR